MNGKLLSPSPDDLATASAIAGRLASEGLGRVRRVVMIGSRARGDPREDSDFDLVVVVETLLHEGVWGAKEFQSERARIQREFGSPRVPTDLWVRTIDRYEEARRVIGGVEHLIDFEGVEVYRDSLTRSPVVRYAPNEVRRQHTYGWVRHAADTLSKAVHLHNTRALAHTRRPQARSENLAAHSATLRAINALLVWHRIFGTKRDGALGMVAKLGTADAKLAASLSALLATGTAPVRIAHAVLQTVVASLGRDPEMVPFLENIRRQISEPLILIGSAPTSENVQN